MAKVDEGILDNLYDEIINDEEQGSIEWRKRIAPIISLNRFRNIRATRIGIPVFLNAVLKYKWEKENLSRFKK